MIVVDTSAVIAALLLEAAADDVIDALRRAPSAVLGAPTRLEVGMVAESRGGAALTRDLDAWIGEAGLEIVEFTARHAQVALDAFYHYGKGRHRAALNYGDCMSYAVAKVADAPLLFVGDDFGHTDVETAINRG